MLPAWEARDALGAPIKNRSVYLCTQQQTEQESNRQEGPLKVTPAAQMQSGPRWCPETCGESPESIMPPAIRLLWVLCHVDYRFQQGEYFKVKWKAQKTGHELLL